jgi:hypothetical protein
MLARRRKIVPKKVTVVLLIICAACSQSISMSSDDMAACEATLRAQWTEQATTLRDVDIFLGTGPVPPWSKDFPSEFYSRFADIPRQLRKRSELDISELKASVTKKWLWYCEVPNRIDADTFELRSGYWCGSLCAHSCLYTLHQKSGQWVIDKSRECIVS